MCVYMSYEVIYSIRSGMCLKLIFASSLYLNGVLNVHMAVHMYI